MTRTGLPETAAIHSAAMLWPGAILGNVLVGIGYDRFRNAAPLAALSAGGVLMLLLFPVLGHAGSTAFSVMLLIIGISIGAHVSMLPPIAALIYPQGSLSTGIALTMTIGRVAAFVSPMIGGVILSMAVAPEFMLMMFAVPLALGALFMCLVIVRANRVGPADEFDQA